MYHRINFSVIIDIDIARCLNYRMRFSFILCLYIYIFVSKSLLYIAIPPPPPKKKKEKKRKLKPTIKLNHNYTQRQKLLKVARIKFCRLIIGIQIVNTMTIFCYQFCSHIPGNCYHFGLLPWWSSLCKRMRSHCKWIVDYKLVRRTSIISDVLLFLSCFVYILKYQLFCVFVFFSWVVEVTWPSVKKQTNKKKGADALREAKDCVFMEHENQWIRGVCWSLGDIECLSLLP